MVVETSARRRSVPQRPSKPAARDLKDQLARCAAALEEGLDRKDLSHFYRTFRATDLPFLPHAYAEQPQGLARACFDVLHKLGGISPAVGLAVENHYYAIAALATFPVGDDPSLEARRRSLLQRILAGRFLVANTNTRVHVDKVNSLGSAARRENGGYRVSGTAAYMSLASESDLMFFLTQIEGEGLAIFVAPLRGNPEIEVGPLLFPTSMVDSDTRRVTFHDPFLAEENALVVGRSEQTSRLMAYQLAWHQALLTVPFLGAAARALAEARRFLLAVRGPNGQPLAELDGMIVDVGRMAIRYRSACCIAHQAGDALERLARRRAPLAAMGEAFELACAAKQVGPKCAEEIVSEVRRVIGGRGFTGAQPIERLSQEVIFGPLGGEVNAFIERRYGRLVLDGKTFTGADW
jgi:alkylation response protein AidB-like acyl-CoA dehydrogenase